MYDIHTQIRKNLKQDILVDIMNDMTDRAVNKLKYSLIHDMV